MKELPEDLEFFVYMTLEELQVVLAVSMALEADGTAANFDSQGELMRWTIWHLHEGFGVQWEYLKPDQRGRLWTDEDEPPVPTNLEALKRLREGVSPDYDGYLGLAIKFMTERSIGFETDLLKEYRWKARQDVTSVRKMFKEMTERERSRMAMGSLQN